MPIAAGVTVIQAIHSGHSGLSFWLFQLSAILFWLSSRSGYLVLPALRSLRLSKSSFQFLRAEVFLKNGSTLNKLPTVCLLFKSSLINLVYWLETKTDWKKKKAKRSSRRRPRSIVIPNISYLSEFWPTLTVLAPKPLKKARVHISPQITYFLFGHHLVTTIKIIKNVEFPSARSPDPDDLSLFTFIFMSLDDSTANVNAVVPPLCTVGRRPTTRRWWEPAFRPQRSSASRTAGDRCFPPLPCSLHDMA